MKKLYLIFLFLAFGFIAQSQYLTIDTIKNIPPYVKVEGWNYDSHDYYNVQENGVGVNFTVQTMVTVGDSIWVNGTESRSIFFDKSIYPGIHALLIQQVVRDSVVANLRKYLNKNE